MNFEIKVSPLAEADMPSILEIELESQPEPWAEMAFLEEINRADSSLLGAWRRQRTGTGANLPEIAGFICFWSVGGEIQILNIAVRKSMRRRGIARKLLETAVRAGLEQHARCVNLEVRESNLAARKLYASLGFRVVGERRNYYGVRNESAILMELEFVPDSLAPDSIRIEENT